METLQSAIKTTKQSVNQGVLTKVVLALMAAFAVPPAAAAPASPKIGSPSNSVASSVPYALKLLFLGDVGSQQRDIPNLQVYFVNATQYELVYRWTPLHTVTFQVEYKAASADPSKEAGWKQLTPVAPPSQPGSFAQSDEHVEREQLRPGQEENLFFLSTLIPLLNEGYYRITATLTLPSASEFRGTVSRSTLVRSFALAISSKPLVIRRTATGFAEVPAPAKTASAH